MRSENKEKIVYTVLCADFFHSGHLNIIKQSKKHGKVMVGLLTDEAIASYKRVPVNPYEKRLELVKNIKGVYKVVPQHTLDYTDNLRKYKPAIVTNGDDWREGVQKETRKQVIRVLEEWGGELIEIPYTKGISSTLIIEDFQKRGVTPEQRRPLLRRMINVKSLVRIIEAHNGLSAIVAENTQVNGKQFDAIWESSLTDSASKGKPDIELVDFTSRVQTINEILEVTKKPLIVDGDTGGQQEHFIYMVRTLERLGVSAVIIEDKRFPKVNSLMPGAKHIQEDIDVFCEKIKAGKSAQITDDFMIIARVESLIAGKSVQDAIKRAIRYYHAGADAIMIHSKDSNPRKVFKFCEVYKNFKDRVPLVIVPTAYNTISEKEMMMFGIDVVIHANHLLRSSYKTMNSVAETILRTGKSCNVDDKCCTMQELFDITSLKNRSEK